MQLNGLGSYRANNLSTPWNNAATSKELAAAHPNASGLSAGLSALRGATKAAPVTPTNPQVNTNTAKYRFPPPPTLARKSPPKTLNPRLPKPQ